MDFQIKLHANRNIIETVTIEMSKKDESKFNSNIDWGNALFLLLQESNTSPFYSLGKKTLKRISSCDTTNKHRSFQCINRFLVNETNCEIPWLKKFAKGLEKCTSTQIRQYFHLYLNMLGRKEDIIKKAKEFGCLVDNCQVDTWKGHEIMKVPSSGPNDTGFAMIGVMDNQVSRDTYACIAFNCHSSILQ